MPYVTSFERLAKEEGREEGIKLGFRAMLKSRFGAEGLLLMPQIDAIHDCELLEVLVERVSRASSLAQPRASWGQD